MCRSSGIKVSSLIYYYLAIIAQLYDSQHSRLTLTLRFTKNLLYVVKITIYRTQLTAAHHLAVAESVLESTRRRAQRTTCDVGGRWGGGREIEEVLDNRNSVTLARVLCPWRGGSLVGQKANDRASAATRHSGHAAAEPGAGRSSLALSSPSETTTQITTITSPVMCFTAILYVQV